MWTQAHALLLLACCLWLTEAQSETSRRKSIWEDPIEFKSKAKDSCTMIITGQGQFTRLRILCQGNGHSYWCEYVGKPHTCHSYNNNPRHFFIQMMWGLRKLQNPCQAPKVIKPHMCKMATDESQMVFSSASFSQPWSESTRSPISKQTGPKPAAKPARPQPRPSPSKPDPPRQAFMKLQVPPGVKTTKPATPRPTAPTTKSNAKKMAQEYCWRSLQGVCAYFFGWFWN